METTNRNKEDFDLAVYILKVLSMRKTTLMSWGFNSLKVIPDGLQFEVNGFIHKGTVQVVYVHGMDLFEVRLIDKENNIIKTMSEIYFDQLVEVIDNNVEKVENYEDRVKQEYDNVHL